MNFTSRLELTHRIIEEAKSLGASLVGVTNLKNLQSSPSHQIYLQVRKSIEIRSIIVLALAHKESEPKLDWWHGKGTDGNTQLENLAKYLKIFLEETMNAKSRLLHYSPYGGGIFLKDSAVLAGLGILGKNNLVITPEFGPRVRFRALATEIELVPAEPIDFDPCSDCTMPCRLICPQKAFLAGCYHLKSCSTQMEKNEAKVKNGIIKYCRACELVCPIGKT